MGVMNIHYVKATSATQALNMAPNPQSPILIKDTETAIPTWYLKFSTLCGWEAQQSIDISILPDYVPKAVDAQKYGWDQTTYSLKSHDEIPNWWQNFTQAEWTAAGGANKFIRGVWDWVIPVHNIVCESMFSEHANKNILGFLYNYSEGWQADYRKAFVFSTRGCDSIRFYTRVATNFGPDPWNTTHSEVGEYTQVWDFCPTYHAERASLNEQGLWIWYNCSQQWNRADDRYAVYETVLADGRIRIAEAQRNIWGTVDWAGRVLIPYSRLSQIPAPGTHLITGKIRFNSVWRATNPDEVGIFNVMDLADIDVDKDSIPDGGTPIEVEGDCNTPTITGRVDTLGRVHLTVGDSGDNGNPITTYEVRLIADYLMTGLDRYHGPNTEITFYEPPWGEPLVYGVVGFDQYGRASDMAKVALPEIEPVAMNGIYRFTSNCENARTINFRFNIDTTETQAPVYESIKLAGRDYQSVFFGEGRTGSFKLNGIIVVDTSPFNRDMGEVSEKDVYDILIGNPCFVRKADGSRDYLAVTNIDVTYARTTPWVAKVSLTCEKVA